MLSLVHSGEPEEVLNQEDDIRSVLEKIILRQWEDGLEP